MKAAPRPGYMESVIDAAREWELPNDYVAGLRRWTLKRLAQPGPQGDRRDLIEHSCGGSEVPLHDAASPTGDF